MKCSECGGSYIEKHDRLTVIDPYIGPVTTDITDYLVCDTCGDILYTHSSAKHLEEAREEALQGILQSMPINAFLTVSETADLLGISRQALHKHRRIRRGFIFQTTFGGKTVYLKESAERFKKTGDGRFPLRKTETASPVSGRALHPETV